MKKLLTSGLGIAVLALAGSANAADLPPRVAYKAPPPPIVAPMYNWTGFYVGGHFGGGWARKSWEDRGGEGGDICGAPGFDFPCVFGTAVGPGLGDVGSHNAIGPLGGFQAGFNWQAPGSHWVFGVEGQFSFADLKGDHQNSISASVPFNEGDEITPFNVTLNDRFHTTVRDIATIAARIGITSNGGTLFYVKGGGAWARDQYHVNSTLAASICDFSDGFEGCGTINGVGSWSANQDRWGWMAGIGLEFALFDNWSAKIEYDYLGFGTRDVSMPGTASGIGCFNTTCATGTFDITRNFHINENIQLVKLGLNYRFNFGKAAPVVARY